ncbi:uncharacterized protein BT62DRAFT_999534 [Guyanagaster necrorhizus]|uniref:Protein kinase domain-containing protein n=1 Tax=Guyanagaster necrorhizus TaxID=856835 RepID=A0A9P7W388_9AGAR|nr:uncharacterized protein BT62DRAFT_999534 [Guyanagaster necrorhizus MCA 3950]KAG7451832.1 hypothetical protein BT62DRAFT_999534 [Guyanagaster necrorhizus MCA 3950]
MVVFLHRRVAICISYIRQNATIISRFQLVLDADVAFLIDGTVSLHARASQHSFSRRFTAPCERIFGTNYFSSPGAWLHFRADAKFLFNSRSIGAGEELETKRLFGSKAFGRMVTDFISYLSMMTLFRRRRRVLWQPDLSWRQTEMFWVQHQPFLHESGYQLHPKFHPDWQPKWKSKTEMLFSEEARLHLSPDIIDVTRARDGKLVALKRVSRVNYPFEVELATFFSSSPLSDDPKNHCIPIYEVPQSLYDHDIQFIVMPRLRKSSTPAFDTMFEGLEFMHENFVAHNRDISTSNIMLDATKLYPKGFHPIHQTLNAKYTGFAAHTTRTLCWPRHYIIDFGYSRRYDPNELPSDVILAASDRSAPELNRLHADPSARLNPFSFDEFHPPLQFLLPLVNDMTQDEPSLRPTISEAVARFARLCNSLTTSQLRASPRGGSAGFSHRCRRLMYTVTGVPPLPAREFSEPVTVIDSCLRSFYTLTPGHVGEIKETHYS